MSSLLIVITKIKATSAITDVVGNDIYTVAAPQNGALPNIIINRTSLMDEQMLGGAAGIYGARIQVDINHTSAALAETLGDLVGAALESIVKETISGFTVDSMRDGVDFHDFNDNRTVFRRVMGFKVTYQA